MRNTDIFLESPRAREFRRELAFVAQTELPILLIGHSGSGKENTARWLHQHSPRRSGPFVKLPCNAIPDDRMFAAHCLGYRKGAYTGADRDYLGYFRQAHRGTLFVDEIDKLSTRHQQTILGPLEGYPYRPLGATKDETSDFRIVAATNQDLQDLCVQGRFLLDLYGRVAAHWEARLPDTRECPDDVAALAQSRALTLLKQGHGDVPAAEHNTVARAAAAAAKELCVHPNAWPLGFREIDGFVLRAIGRGVDEAASQLRNRWAAFAKSTPRNGQNVSSTSEPPQLAHRPTSPASPRYSAYSPPFPTDALAGLIRSILRNPESTKQPAGGAPEDALAMARVLASADRVAREDIENALSHRYKPRVVNRALVRLEEAALITRCRDQVELCWPLVEVQLFRLASGTSDVKEPTQIAPRTVTYASNGDRFAIQVRPQLPMVLDMWLITHVVGDAASDDAATTELSSDAATTELSSARAIELVSGQDLTPGKPVWHEWVLDETAGFEQLLIHLAWPGAHRGAQVVAAEHEPLASPSPAVLQAERKHLNNTLGPGWLEEFWLIHR